MADEVHSSPFPLDRWLRLAQNKLKNGYVLQMENQRRNARFFRRGFGYEPCPYQAAQYLVQTGYVVVARENDREITFELADGVAHIEASKIHTEEKVLDEEDVEFVSEEDDELDEEDFENEDLEEPPEEDD